jgi:hypothetical protein
MSMLPVNKNRELIQCHAATRIYDAWPSRGG